jgi:predicted phosphodiesterase
MSILVTADVHLTGDRPERRRALERVVDRCEEEGVRYLLIAGDLFDADVDVEDVKTDIRDLFSGNNFQTFAIPGNHDRTAYRDEDYFGDDIEILKEQPFAQRDLGEVNLVAVPFGAFPMCHGSGGIAGKYAFGARTAGSNLILGGGYILTAVLAVGLITAYPLAMLGMILIVIAAQLGYTSLRQASEYWLVIGIAVLGVIVNLGIALIVGIVVFLVFRHR